jgi:hypothetical protein
VFGSTLDDGAADEYSADRYQQCGGLVIEQRDDIVGDFVGACDELQRVLHVNVYGWCANGYSNSAGDDGIDFDSVL